MQYNNELQYSTESYNVGLVYIHDELYVVPSNSFDKQLCDHKKVGGISGWGNGNNTLTKSIINGVCGLAPNIIMLLCLCTFPAC